MLCPSLPHKFGAMFHPSGFFAINLETNENFVRDQEKSTLIYITSDKQVQWSAGSLVLQS